MGKWKFQQKWWGHTTSQTSSSDSSDEESTDNFVVKTAKNTLSSYQKRKVLIFEALCNDNHITRPYMTDIKSTHDVEIKYDATKAEHDEIFDSFCVSKKRQHDKSSEEMVQMRAGEVVKRQSGKAWGHQSRVFRCL